MKKIPLLFLVPFIFSSLLFSKDKIEDNTFISVIVNNSDFSISVDGQALAPGEQMEHKFPLHTSAMAVADWNVEYTVPLTESVRYVFEESKALSDNQKSFVIENPVGKFITDCYVVIANDSDEVVQCKGRGTISYSCYTKGVVNSGKELPSIGTVPAHSTAVCPIKVGNEFYIAPDTLNERLPANISYRKGYVYWISYKNQKITLLDARPIQSAKEKLWKKEFIGNVIARKVVQQDGALYVLGTESARDSKNNIFVSGFVQKLGKRGAEEWKLSYGVQGSDTFLYDMIFDGKSFIVAGQSISENIEGIVFSFSPDGKLLDIKKEKASVGFDRVERKPSGEILVHGYGADEKPVSFLVKSGLSLERRSSQNNAAKVSSVIQSAGASVYGQNDVLYVAGERAGMEKPIAAVAKVVPDGGVEILYSAHEPFSFISDMKINRELGQLLICGSLGARDQYGNGGRPFVRCIDIKTGGLVWESVYKTWKYEAAVSITALEDYGFAVVLLNADKDGDPCAPSAVVRTDSVGLADFK